MPHPIADDAAPDGLPNPRRKAALVAIYGAYVLVVLDAVIANVALPSIAHALRAPPAHTIWIVTAYQLALVMTLLPCAALGESVGFARVFIAGTALFTAASALCALAPSLAWLVAARFVQGLGGAAIMSLGAAMIRAIMPQHRMGAAIGWSAMTVALSSAAGPSLGAGILSIAPWPWLFAVNLPVGAFALLAARALPRGRGTGRRIDVLSVVLNAAAFAAVVQGAGMLPDAPALGAGLIAAAAAGFAALVLRELTVSAPLIPIDLLRGAAFRLAVVASTICFCGQAAAMVALPFYLQHGLGLSTFMTGLTITPWPLAVAVTGPLSGRLADRVPGQFLCAAGCACLALGLAGVAFWPVRGQPWQLIPLIILCGAGFGMFQVPNNRTMILAAPLSRSGAAGGMQATARLAGQTAGAVLMTVLFTLHPVIAPRAGLAAAAALTAVAGLVSAARGGAGRGVG